VVGMARSQDPDSAGSQWFVTLGDATHLNGQYTVFGKVVEGMEFVDCIEVGDRIIDLAIQEI
jgi:peptidylprolyl isomerase